LNTAEHFRDEGFAVLEAGSGEAALSHLDAPEQIDALFTDIRLGGQINGWDVAEAFRVRFPRIVVLYTSGNSISPSRHVERSRFFTKPYEPEAIADACREFCGQSQFARSGKPRRRFAC